MSERIMSRPLLSSTEGKEGPLTGPTSTNANPSILLGY